MKIIKPHTEIISTIDSQEILETIELIARTCYKSEDKIQDGSAAKMVERLIKSGHEAMLEHCSISVKFVCDRGISHELVRHRMASFAQESTRYCNYANEDFGSEITFIEPFFLAKDTEGWYTWQTAMQTAEGCYFDLLDWGCTPQEARSVLPNSLKTEVVMTCNLREWRHFFKLRAAGTTGAPHPQMLELTVPLLLMMQKVIPVVFADIHPCEKGLIFVPGKENNNDTSNN